MASEIPTRAPNGFLVFVGTAGLLVVVAALFIEVIGVTGAGGETLEQKRAAKRVETRVQLEREAQERLNSTGWVDKAKGTVHIPITEAIVAVVAELKVKKLSVSPVKVEAPLPMPVVDPNSKYPAPPALPSAPQGADTIRFTYPTAAPATPVAPAPAALPVPATLPAPKPAEAPAKPVPAPAAPAAPAPAPATPAPVPAVPVPAPVPAHAPATAPVPAPPPAPAPAPKPAAVTPPAPAPAPPAPAAVAPPAPVTPPTAPNRPPIINPTENSEPTK